MAKQSKPQTILITGVTRGLGRAMVEEFAGSSSSHGNTVIGCARTKSEIKELARIYRKHDFQTVNVASDTEVAAWSKRLLKKYGPPDFVLNNAAIINLKAPLWEVGTKEFSDVVDINIKGVVNVIRHFVPAMIRRKSGVIVNFSSRWGESFDKQMGPYCATKWAVMALTQVLAEELKPFGVAAIALNPGIIRTEMLQRYLGLTIGPSQSCYPTPAKWAKMAAPYILSLKMSDTGKLRKVPSR